MRKLALVTVAAAAIAAALPSAAAAQPRAGHSWQEDGQRVIVRHGGDMQRHRRGGTRQFRRIQRGHVVPNFWAAPQFHVRHWQMYGFPQPMPGTRWVRYYDDALLVGRDGRVHDGRYGFDWDRYGHHWGYDEGGVPVYVGDGDFHPTDRDYAWADEVVERGYARRGGYREHHGGGWDYSEYGRGGGCGPSPCGSAPPPASSYGCGPSPCGGPAAYPGPAPYPAPAYGYGQASYGYGGYGCCATVTIVETTVESGGQSYMVEEVIEEEVVRERARRVHRRPPPRRPIRGERG